MTNHCRICAASSTASSRPRETANLKQRCSLAQCKKYSTRSPTVQPRCQRYLTPGAQTNVLAATHLIRGGGKRAGHSCAASSRIVHRFVRGMYHGRASATVNCALLTAITAIDSRELGETQGFDIRAELLPDPDTRPQDFDCYSAVDIEAWKQDQWSFVTTKITASRAGIELGNAYLGGSDYGQLPGAKRFVNPLEGDGEAFVNGYGPQLIEDAIAEATEAVAKIAAADR